MFSTGFPRTGDFQPETAHLWGYPHENGPDNGGAESPISEPSHDSTRFRAALIHILGWRAMRIRQVRPEFWQDEEVASWPEGLRLFYIGLWGVCDDAGYFDFVPSRIAALVYPYEARKRRENRVELWLQTLVAASKVRLFDGCDHALVPTLPVHQKSGGNPSFVTKKAHDGEVRTSTESPVSNGNGRERYVEVGGVTGGHAAPLGARGGLADKIGSFEQIVGGKAS